MGRQRPVRFVHTADWQLGLRARFIPGDDGAVVRDARLRTVRRIAALAQAERAEFVVVAGDVFEHHGLSPVTIRRTFDALAEFSVPVYLLPGNHDPLTPDAIYRSDLWRECPPQVQVLGTTAPVLTREGVCLLPCPLLARHTLEDPTAHLTPDTGPADAVRIAVAHGGILEILRAFGDSDYEPANAISRHVVKRAALDYLALGDWHGRLAIDERTVYSGTPEPTRFKEKDPGKALVVEIDGPGGVPRVEAHDVATLTWRQETFPVSEPDDLVRLEAFLDGLPGKADTLLELTLEGALDVELRDRLDRDVLAPAGQRLRWLRVRDEGLHVAVGADALAELAGDGWVRDVVEALRARGGEDAERALRLLYRLHRDVAP